MSILDNTLPHPDFITRAPDTVVRDLIAQFETLTGRTLYPAQVERILIDVIAYRESLLREGIQDAARLNLVRFSRAPMLDYIGENIGVTRLTEKAANTTLQFSFSPAPTVNTVLPAGTLVSVGDLAFATIEDVVVTSGANSTQVLGQCTQVGEVGNGFAIGQINTLFEAVPGLSISAVSNVDVTAGGAGEEEDDAYRERIVLAPESFTTAGSIGAYQYHARSAHQSIIAVAVTSPVDGHVYLWPLTKTGLPSDAIKAQVADKCSPDTVRPLCDTVVVQSPNQINYSVDAHLTLFASANAATALAQANERINAFAATMRLMLGKDIVRSQMIDVLSGYGIYKVDLIAPASDIVLADEDWPNATSVNVTIVGLANG